jgi:DNA-directed RNA polymerase alpha subunit
MVKYKEYYVKVSDIMKYCKESAAINRDLANKCIENTGKGETLSSSLGGAAYFLQQAKMYDYDIPNVIQALDYETIDSVLSNPLEALGLSTRTYNCLRRADIETLGDITKLYPHELKQIRNLGSNSFKEVIKTIEKYGVNLKGEK